MLQSYSVYVRVSTFCNKTRLGQMCAISQFHHCTCFMSVKIRFNKHKFYKIMRKSDLGLLSSPLLCRKSTINVNICGANLQVGI